MKNNVVAEVNAQLVGKDTLNVHYKGVSKGALLVLLTNLLDDMLAKLGETPNNFCKMYIGKSFYRILAEMVSEENDGDKISKQKIEALIKLAGKFSD